MTEKPASSPKKDQKTLRQERLEAQLRENLKKRKALSRARNSAENPVSEGDSDAADD